MSHGSDLVKRGRRPKHAQTRFSAHRSYEGGQSHGWVLGPRAMNINMQHISTSSPNMFHHVLSSFHGKIWEMYTRSFFSECAWQASPTEIHLKLHDSRMGSDTHTHHLSCGHIQYLSIDLVPATAELRHERRRIIHCYPRHGLVVFTP